VLVLQDQHGGPPHVGWLQETHQRLARLHALLAKDLERAHHRAEARTLGGQLEGLDVVVRVEVREGAREQTAQIVLGLRQSRRPERQGGGSADERATDPAPAHAPGMAMRRTLTPASRRRSSETPPSGYSAL
jgi:hypothetical protein